MVVLYCMSSVVSLESTTLREKLLSLLKKGIPQAIVNDIQLIIHESGKAANIASKVNNILEEKTQDKLLYSYPEWAAAYVIAHEQKTLEELIEIHETSIIKHKHNMELSDHIRKRVF